MKIFILIISFVLGSNIDVNISPIDINQYNQERRELTTRKLTTRELTTRKLTTRKLSTREKVDNQSYNVPSGYKHKGGDTYAYGEWFVSFTYGETVKPYGLDNYSRMSTLSDFTRKYNNQTINFKMYQTDDRRGYYAVARRSQYINQYVTIGVYKSGRYALSSSFGYKKHITKIYEYVSINN